MSTENPHLHQLKSTLSSSMSTSTSGQTVIQTQPFCSFQPWQFLSAEHDNDDNFEEILEQQQCSAGFEIVADTNMFTVRHRFHEKDPYTKVSKYDVLDGNQQQYLFVCCKEYNYKCFNFLVTTTVSGFTDAYKDPIFKTTSYFSGKSEFCCKITTVSGNTIGLIQKLSVNDFNNDFDIRNEFEDTVLNVIGAKSDTDEDSIFDIWEGPACIANIARDTKNNETIICTIGSLTSVNKVLLLGFTFYVDGIHRGDNNGLNLFSYIGL